MPIDYAVLKTEIQTDPNTLGYAGKGDQNIADILNNPKIATLSRGIVPASQFYGDLANLSVPYKVKLVPDNASPVEVSAGVFVPIAAVKQAVDDLKYSMEVNTAAPSVQGLLGASVLFGALSQAEMTDLIMRKGSRAEALFGAGTFISNNDVSFALRGNR